MRSGSSSSDGSVVEEVKGQPPAKAGLSHIHILGGVTEICE